MLLFFGENKWLITFSFHVFYWPIFLSERKNHVAYKVKEHLFGFYFLSQWSSCVRDKVSCDEVN